MSRTEALETIAQVLPSLGDDDTIVLADIARQMLAAGVPTRELSGRERQLIARSKTDFAAGHSYTPDELRALLDQRLAPLGVPASAPKSRP